MHLKKLQRALLMLAPAAIMATASPAAAQGLSMLNDICAPWPAGPKPRPHFSVFNTTGNSTIAHTGLFPDSDAVDPTPYQTQGQSGRLQLAESLVAPTNPLYARVLVLADGSQAVALVTLDLGRSFGPPQIAAVRARIRRDYRVDEVMFVASHTHSGPVIDDEYDGPLPEWERRALDKLRRHFGAGRTAKEERGASR